MIEFPKNFLWGAATSAHQVEGNNTNSDWWEWEKKAGLTQVSGQACRHYELYESDFDLAKSLGHNAHRLSVEWARIEPQEGIFSEQELRHYRGVLSALRERSLEPVVTLHHFTNPAWFSHMGGWENKRSGSYFLRYIQRVTEALGDQVRYWVTINEPLIYVYHSYLLGTWPPQKKSLCKAQRVENNLAAAHIKAYRLIHDIYRQKGFKSASVSIAKNVQAFIPCRPTFRNRFAVYLRGRWFNYNFVERLLAAKALDFIGINYYSRNLVEVRSWWPVHLGMDTCKDPSHHLKKNSLGWEIYPQGLYDLLIRFKKYNLPLMITENGICVDDDFIRWEYIRDHLESVHRAMQEGARVLGYLYWSLLDNYEWEKGFIPRFGLVEVDYNSYARRPRESARKFAAVCTTGRLEHGAD
jgi:beta-glucosidase